MPAALKDWPGLAAALSRFDDVALSRLLALRPDLASPPPRDWGTLASRAGAWPSARAAYRELDRAGLRVAESLCLLPQPAALADLAALLGVAEDDADLASTLAGLEERALAFRLGDGHVRLLPALRQLDYPAGLGPPLASLLASLTGPSLEQMALRLGARPGKLMAETREAIIDLLSDPTMVGPLIDGAPAGVAELAARAAAEGPLVSVPGGLYGVTDRTPAGWMVNRGLLGVVDYYTAVMPREPIIALRGGRVSPADALRRPGLATAAVDTDTVDRTAAERSAQVVADVASILDLWSAEPAAVLKAGGMGIREVRRVAKVIDRTEAEAARIIELTAVAGLARADFASAHAAPTEAYDGWLALDTAARWARLATAWLEADLHLSVAGAIGEKNKPLAPLLHRAPERDARRRRRAVLDVLLEVGAGEAAAPAAVRDRAQWDGPGAWTGGPAAPPTLVYWALTEGELLGVCALGALSAAGRALVSGRPHDATDALAALVPPAVSEFVIQADLTAVIAGQPAPAVGAELDLLADVESKGAATVYRFTEQSLRRAFDRGRTAADVLGFLEGHATRGVPQPLVYLINDMGRRFGNVRVGAVTSYLRSDDPALVAEVLASRAAGKLHLRSVAPTVLVTDVDAAVVTSTLQAAGYLPAREGPDGGLLLAAPAAHRLPPSRFPTPRPSPAPDIPRLVAALRGTPVAAPPAPAAVPAGGGYRPAEIVKLPRAVCAILEMACDAYWLVRMGHVDDRGRSLEVTVEPIEVDGKNLYATQFPDGDERRFPLERIEWVRVLTEAEESLL